MARSKLLTDAVSKGEDGTWDFECPGIADSVCGDPHSDQAFTSTGWPSRKVAEARGAQHFDEHQGLSVTPDLDAFRAEHGLMPHANGIHAVRIEDLA